MAPHGLARCAQMARIHSILDSGLEPAIIDGRIYRLETAATDDQRARGLMQRDHLDADAGMIFIYPREQLLSFWMGHCLIDLDILFLDDRRRIVSMRTMPAEPPQGPGESDSAYSARMPRYTSSRFARYAIELPAGTIESLRLKLGDTVRFHAID